jgi:hypothetical protein
VLAALPLRRIAIVAAKAPEMQMNEKGTGSIYCRPF